MDNDSLFCFPMPHAHKGRTVSQEEAERILLHQLNEQEKKVEDVIWQLIRFYSITHCQKTALSYADRMLAATSDPEKRADCFLAMGQLMEQLGDFSLAEHYYRNALSHEPLDRRTWYFINNNLGYCLNTRREFSEAEAYCRTAITADPERHNAYKNLGVSLDGQGRHGQAALCYVKAVQKNAADPRALHLLENIMNTYSTISSEIPDLPYMLEMCRNAVKMAEEVFRRNIGNG